jgi:hypothetical protein
MGGAPTPSTRVGQSTDGKDTLDFTALTVALTVTIDADDAFTATAGISPNVSTVADFRNIENLAGSAGSGKYAQLRELPPARLRSI